MKTINKNYSALLLFGFGAILLLMTGLIISSVISMNKTRQNLNMVIDEHLAKVALSMNMRAASHIRTITLFELMYFDDPFKRDEAWMNFNGAASNFMVSRNKILNMPLSKAERDLLSSLSAVSGVNGPMQRRVVDLVNEGRNDEASLLLNEKVVPVQADVHSIMEKFVAHQWSMAQGAQKQAITEIETMRSVLLFLGIAALLAGVVIAIIIVNIIRQRTELEKQLNRSQKMDAIGKLTGGIAHDYNNMMGIVLGYSELLLSQVEDNEKAISYVVNIRTAGERARDLTLKLMTFSRNKRSDKTAVSINQELENQAHLLEKTLTSRIQLNLDLNDDLWAVHLDSGDFNDAIINMTINASHAIEATGTVNISTNTVHLNKQEAGRLELTEGDYVRVLFTDSGKGMDSQTTSKIFDPFFSTKGDKGTGLGLSQVYGFVTRSGGAIKVNSELNSGTELILYFPRYYDRNSKQKNLESTNKNTSLPSHETILVVDDEEVLCIMTKEILENQGYHVLLAFSGAKALEILKTERVDIVFSDVIMPEMTGYELATKISDEYPDILIQLTSGYTGNEKLKSLDNSSTFDILDKPYASSELLNKISTLLNKK